MRGESTPIFMFIPLCSPVQNVNSQMNLVCVHMHAFFFANNFVCITKPVKTKYDFFCMRVCRGERCKEKNQNLFMGGKLVLTRLCHGLTPAVQLLEKLFYLHTLNDLLNVSLHKKQQLLLYTPFSVFLALFFCLRFTQCIAWQRKAKHDRK